MVDDGEPSASRPSAKSWPAFAIIGVVIAVGYAIALVETARLPAPTSWWLALVLVLSAAASAYGGIRLGRYLNRRHRSRLAQGAPAKGPGPGFPIVLGLCAVLGPALGRLAGGGPLSDGFLLAIGSIVLTFGMGVVVGALRTHAKEGPGSG